MDKLWRKAQRVAGAARAASPRRALAERTRWRVRPAAPTDVAVLSRLWHEADELHAQLSPGFFRRPDATRGRQRAVEALRDVEDNGGHEVILLGIGAGAVCGACHLQIYDTPVGHSMVAQRRGHVETLIVGRAHRRRGCGRALMQAASEWAREKGAHQLLLTVWAGNDEAERFYTALGYRTISQVLGNDL
jgi:ribosomal protein S18 acetylase RimI-like enzyme